MLQQFCQLTLASPMVAKDVLQKCNFNVEMAVNMYHEQSHKFGGGGGNSWGGGRGAKPGLNEQRQMIQAIVTITQVSEQRAGELLERAHWSKEGAIELFYTQGDGGGAVRS